MPLLKGKSKKAFSSNVKEEMEHGKPQKQALAIAYSMKRKGGKKMSKGGNPYDKMEDSKRSNMAAGGSVSSGDPTMNYSEGGMCSHGGPVHCTAGCYEDGGQVQQAEPTPAPQPPLVSQEEADKFKKGANFARGGEAGYQSEAHEADMVGRILKKMYSKGGEVANSDKPVADFESNEFDDLHLRDGLEEHYTGANSGDEDDDHDIINRIMKKRKQS